MPTVEVILTEGPNVLANVQVGQPITAQVVEGASLSATVSAAAATPGAPGAAATISVGSVTTVNPGDPATVVNSGTSSAAVFDFEIPEGDPGDNGTNGTNFRGFFSGVPTGGANGDWGVNQETGDVYERQAGVWTLISAFSVPCAQARQSAFSISSGITTCSFDVTDISTAGEITHNSGVNPQRFTFVKTGRYLLDFRTMIQSATANQRVIFEFRVNGSTILPIQQEGGTGNATQGRGAVALTYIADLNAGDYVEVLATKTNGSAATASTDQTIFLARRIGGLSELSGATGYGADTLVTLLGGWATGGAGQQIRYRTGLGGHVVLSGRATAGASPNLTMNIFPNTVPSPPADVVCPGWYAPASGNPQGCSVRITTSGVIIVQLAVGGTLATNDVIIIDGANYFA